MEQQRYAFVVASQWGVHPDLETLRTDAGELRDLLTDPNRGDCLPAHGDGLLFDPGAVTDVRAALRGAFERAGAARSPLLLAFLGHGYVCADGEFLFPVTTSPGVPDSATAFAVPACLRELLLDYGGVRGLTVVVDACSAGAAALAAAQEWFPSAMHTGREIEVLASTDGRPAYGLTFSRALNRVVRHGHVRLERVMHTRPLARTLGAELADQRPQAVTWSGSHPAGKRMPIPHWVARNVAHDHHLSVVAATAGGGLLNRLTYFQAPPTLPDLHRVVLGHRAVALQGPLGSGKTTLVAALSRPELLPEAAGRSEWVDAVVTVIAATGQGAVLPKALLADAAARLDGPDTEGVDQILELLPGLVDRISRPDAGELLGAHHQALVEHVIEEEPDLLVTSGHATLAAALESMAPMDQHTPGDPLHSYAAEAEPVHLWHTGEYERLLESLDSRGSADAAANRDRWLAWCDRLTERPGPEERPTLRARQKAAYWAGRAGSYRRSQDMYREVLAVQQRALPADDEDILESRHRIAYATGEVGDFGEAVALHGALLAMHQDLVRDQRRVLGDYNHPAVMITRFNIARLTAELGDADGALEELHELLARRRARYPIEEHPEVLTTRFAIAELRARTGHLDEAVDALRTILADRRRTLGDRHPEVLLTQSSLAELVGRGRTPGAAIQAETALRDTLRQQCEMLDEGHPEVLSRPEPAWRTS